MKKNYDEELLDLSFEVWGQKNQEIIEESPSEESILENEIGVGIRFPDVRLLSFDLTREFIKRCESKFGKNCPQQESAIGQYGTSIMLIWRENLRVWRKNTHDVKTLKEMYSEEDQEKDLSDIYESLKFFAEETGANQASCETEDKEWKYIVTAKRKDEDR